MATASASAAKPAAGAARNRRSAIEPATWSASVRTSGMGSDGFRVRMRSRTAGARASGSPVVRTTRCDTPVATRRHETYTEPARGAASPWHFMSSMTAMTGESPRAMSRISTPYGIERPTGSSFGIADPAPGRAGCRPRWNATASLRTRERSHPRCARVESVIEQTERQQELAAIRRVHRPGPEEEHLGGPEQRRERCGAQARSRLPHGQRGDSPPRRPAEQQRGAASPDERYQRRQQRRPG